MLKSPIWPSVKDVTRWAGSLHTRSTEDGTPSSSKGEAKFMLASRERTRGLLGRESRRQRLVTFVFVEHGEGRRRGVGVPQSHRPVGRAGEEALVGTAVHQAPHRVRVSAQRPPQHRRVCEKQSRDRGGSARHDLSTFDMQHCISGGKAALYRRSRMGQCWGWGCSSTGWFHQHLH